ncbi:hypothetical protein PF003_g5606 [Phytophthora fragariae]|nr:hypothetical protein PF003_g5606 [Phytophthora fragariae]
MTHRCQHRALSLQSCCLGVLPAEPPVTESNSNSIAALSTCTIHVLASMSHDVRGAGQ